MIELNEKYSIFYIPLYFSNDTYKVFQSNDTLLNDRQILLKTILKKNKYSLGMGIGVFNVIKIC